MKPYSGQSALIHMTEARPAPVRTWLVQCPPGMLAHGHKIKRFTSPDAFDAYVRCVRQAGYTVRFASPWSATVEAKA